jgi:ethanolamine ammonia-lyase large subunit
MAEVRGRGVYLAEGYGSKPWTMEGGLDREIRALYDDSKKVLWVEMPEAFIASLPHAVPLKTRSADRTDYILHPQTGEEPDEASVLTLKALRAGRGGPVQVQIVVSDGLNATAVMDPGHLAPYLAALGDGLRRKGFPCAVDVLVVRGGRVRAGYRIGELLFRGPADRKPPRAIIHIIGERPGTLHHTFSAYITAAAADVWGKGGIDHNITQVVSGIADTALKPELAAEETLRIVSRLMERKTGKTARPGEIALTVSA